MKLVVEVVEAHDLMPRNGEGSSSAFAEVDYDNHLSRTRTVTKDLNPVWDQKLEFAISNPEKFRTQSIQISVYNDRKSFPGRNFLGKARVHCSSIVCEGEEVLQRFPLEKKWFFSPVKGDIALKLYVSPKSVGSVPVADEKEESKETAEKEVTVQTLRHISKNQFTPQPGKTVEEKSSGGATAPVVMMHQAKPSSADEYKLKDTSPQLGERWRTGGHWRGGWMGIGADHKLTSTYDLVEQMHYLYVRVVKAKDLPTNPVTGSCDPYAEVKLGNYKGTTKHLEKKTNPEWNQASSLQLLRTFF